MSQRKRMEKGELDLRCFKLTVADLVKMAGRLPITTTAAIEMDRTLAAVRSLDRDFFDWAEADGSEWLFACLTQVVAELGDAEKYAKREWRRPFTVQKFGEIGYHLTISAAVIFHAYHRLGVPTDGFEFEAFPPMSAGTLDGDSATHGLHVARRVAELLIAKIATERRGGPPLEFDGEVSWSRLLGLVLMALSAFVEVWQAAVVGLFQLIDPTHSFWSAAGLTPDGEPGAAAELDAVLRQPAERMFGKEGYAWVGGTVIQSGRGPFRRLKWDDGFVTSQSETGWFTPFRKGERFKALRAVLLKGDRQEWFGGFGGVGGVVVAVKPTGTKPTVAECESAWERINMPRVPLDELLANVPVIGDDAP
jgi:hypothetical protein